MSPNKNVTRVLNAKEVLFEEGDHSDCFYIVQLGQLKLYRRKGHEEIELATIGPGEVIGELSFFDKGRRVRSCSAVAAAKANVIEVPFKALEVAMNNSPSWFKTIIFTLAYRLRDATDRIKELESGSKR